MTSDPRAAAARWAATWHDALEALDVDAIVALYAPGAVFSSEPFREAFYGPEGVRAYVVQAFAEERSPRVRVSDPIVDGNRASISWWASLVESGVDATLAGTSVLRFDEAGLVIEQWDTWNVRDGRADPPTWAVFDGRDR